MTLTEVLENDFLLPLMQEAGAEAEGSVCRHSRPTRPPPAGVPLEHFCVGRNSCWTVALTHLNHGPPRGPDPVVQQCCFRYSQWEQLYVLQAGFGSEEQRLLQTPDLVVLLISYLLKNAPTVGVFVCLFHFMGVSHPNFFRLSWQRTNWLTGIGELFHSSFSKGTLLDYYPSVDIQKSPWEESEVATLS